MMDALRARPTAEFKDAKLGDQGVRGRWSVVGGRRECRDYIRFGRLSSSKLLSRCALALWFWYSRAG